MSTFTPGPWTYHVASNYLGFSICPRGLLPSLASVERPVGNSNISIIDCFNFPGSTEANARLIAAAPDLLEALREIDWLCDGREDVDDGQPNTFMKIGIVARSAFAKATGDQP